MTSRNTWLLVPWRAARNFYADNCLDRAAAVAYFSLLSLAPSLYLLSLVMSWLLPDAAGTVDEAIRGAAAFLPPSIAPSVRLLAENVRIQEGLVVVALPGLLWMASSAFLSLELAVNVAFRTVERRRFWLARLKAFIGSALAGLLLLVSAALTQGLVWFERSRASLGLAPLTGAAPRLSALAHLGATFAAFALLYKILPRGRVRWRIAAASAGGCVVLWELARRLFGGLLERSPGFGLLTGSLAGVVAFLLWVYTASALLLFGAEVAAVLNGNRRPAEAEAAPPAAVP